MSFSLPQLLGRFQDDPLQFARDFGMSAWYGVSAWLLVAPVAALLIKLAVLPILRQLTVSLKRRKEVEA